MAFPLQPSAALLLHIKPHFKRKPFLPSLPIPTSSSMLRRFIRSSCTLRNSFLSPRIVAPSYLESPFRASSLRPFHFVPNLSMSHKEKASITPEKSHNFTNRLAAEHSPYLLQLAHNPVDWYPWGEEAFQEARNRDVPIFLSMHAMSGGNKLTWGRCYELYSTRWGWSKEEITQAFKKHPHCMILSEKKLTESMKFLVEEMGWPSNFIVTCPHILFFSLEKRIKPRCSVVQVLNKKGLIKNNVSLNTLLVPSEEYFLEKFVDKYLEQVPDLLSVYEGEISVSDA